VHKLSFSILSAVNIVTNAEYVSHIQIFKLRLTKIK